MIKKPFVLLALVMLLAACGTSVPEVVGSLPTGTLGLGEGDLELQVEIALTPAAQTRGLMAVEDMPDDYGMVFLWSTPGRRGFHMLNTLIPLDIAFWDDNGVVVDVQQMVPCAADPCPIYSPARDHVAAVEVNAGVLQEADIRVGAQVDFRPNP